MRGQLICLSCGAVFLFVGGLVIRSPGQHLLCWGAVQGLCTELLFLYDMRVFGEFGRATFFGFDLQLFEQMFHQRVFLE